MVSATYIRKTRRYLARLVTGLMVVWLAVFYSAICEYHGLMLPIGPNRMEQMGANMATMSMAMQAQATHVHRSGMKMQMTSALPLTCKTNTGAPLLQLGRMALNTVALSFLVISSPVDFRVQLVLKQSSLAVEDPSISHQCRIAPLDPPPRFQPL